MLIRASVVALILACFSGVASAFVDIEWVPVDNHGLIPGYSTYDMYIDTDGTWCCSAMVFELSQGSFYQDPLGGITKPSPALISLVPTVEFDTYVAEGDYLDIIVLPGAGDVGGEPFLIFDETILNLSWAPPGGARSTGRFHLVRVSITSDAEGSWIMGTVGTGIPRIDFAGTVEDLVPEPGTFGLLAVPAVLIARRRMRV